LLVVGGESRLPDPAATPEIGELRRLATELEMGDRVLVTGKRDREELRDYYGAGDVMVTTPWYEPFGLTPLEAMACGRPVVGADVGGISFTVRHGETGLLVPPRSPAALAAALRGLLADPTRRARMGAAGRRRVEREFTWRSVAERTRSTGRSAGARSCP
jgi:D-inositol-3-phosphate glycosyltransferase